MRDMEFIQFHPTALSYPGAPRFLISEAVRGEGAVLRNINGERFMERYHELLELAPRDIVARAIVSEMELTKSTFVYLDITHESADMVKHRFPTIYETCMGYGLDITTDWIPVAPAAHYMMGALRPISTERAISPVYSPAVRCLPPGCMEPTAWRAILCPRPLCSGGGLLNAFASFLRSGGRRFRQSVSKAVLSLLHKLLWSGGLSCRR